MVVIGGVVTARVGFTPLFGETASILGVEMTSFVGLVQMVIGLTFIGSAASPGSARSALIGSGAALIAVGSILFIEPGPFGEPLGEAREIGTAYGVVGLVALISGIASTTRSTRAYESVVDGD